MRNSASSRVRKTFLIFSYGMNWITVTKTVHINHICIHWPGEYPPTAPSLHSIQKLDPVFSCVCDKPPSWVTWPTSWFRKTRFTQERVHNKLYIKYSRGVPNAPYSSSDCRAIHKTGWIAALEGNLCITIFVMNQAEDRWRMVPVGLRKSTLDKNNWDWCT
jgi:hypothetical protein